MQNGGPFPPSLLLSGFFESPSPPAEPEPGTGLPALAGWDEAGSRKASETAETALRLP